MKKFIKNTAIFIILILFVFGCAANKPQSDYETTDQDVDNLFGISEDDASSSQESDDEAEVLRLLGITPEESTEDKVIEPTNDENEERLSNEITDLESQLSQKESEIADLKSELAIKDQKIKELGATISMQARSERYSASGAYKSEYQNALSYYNNRSYKTAINIFESLLTKDNSSSLSDNYQYWMGECYYGLGNFSQAIVEFTKVFSFTKSNKLDDAQLKLGLCYWKLGDGAKAREEFERLISNYPNSEYVDKAKYFMSRL